MESSRYEKDRVYWQEVLSPIPEVASIPLNKTIHNTNNIKAHRLEFIFNEKLISKIKSFCTENNISVFNFLMSVYSIYLGRINNMENFLAELKNTAGKVFKKSGELVELSKTKISNIGS